MFLWPGPGRRLAEIVRDLAAWTHRAGLSDDALHTRLLTNANALGTAAFHLAEAADHIDDQAEQMTARQARSQAALTRSPISSLAAGMPVVQGDGVPTSAATARHNSALRS